MDKKAINAHLSFLREFLKYFAASSIALLVDYATYWTFAQNNLVELTAAASLGYTAGLIVAYFLISEKVFSDGWLKERRTHEMLLFALSGVFGITLTYGSVALYVIAVGESIHGAKLFAVAVSFVCVYLFRKLFVFRSTNT